MGQWREEPGKGEGDKEEESEAPTFIMWTATAVVLHFHHMPLFMLHCTLIDHQATSPHVLRAPFMPTT